MASLFNIHIRTGCFCNTGACQHYLAISNQNVKSNLHVSGFSPIQTLMFAGKTDGEMDGQKDGQTGGHTAR